MATTKKNTATASQEATAVATATPELSAKDVALKTAAAKVEAEFNAKRKADLAAKAAAKAATVIPEGTTGKALTKKARRAKFELPEGYNTLLEYITAWATTQSANGNEAALLRVAKSLNRVTNPSEAHNKDWHDKQIDSLGDIFVVLVVYALQNGLHLDYCVKEAYDTIKYRHGKMIDGVFVKDSDLEEE